MGQERPTASPLGWGVERLFPRLQRRREGVGILVPATGACAARSLAAGRGASRRIWGGFPEIAQERSRRSRSARRPPAGAELRPVRCRYTNGCLQGGAEVGVEVALGTSISGMASSRSLMAWATREMAEAAQARDDEDGSPNRHGGPSAAGVTLHLTSTWLCSSRTRRNPHLPAALRTLIAHQLVLRT